MTIGHERTVLIVEDDETTAELERRVLLRSGMNAHVVGRVKDAIALLERQSFAAILVDYHLPDGDPWAIVDAAERKNPRIPVVIVTGQGTERIASEAIHRGVADYVKKSEAFWDQLPGIVDRVTRLARAEETLRRSEDFFERARIGAAIRRPDGTLERVNLAFAEMHGFTIEELVGKPAALMFAPEWRSRVAVFLQAVDERGGLRFEADHVRKDGSVFPVVVDATAVKDAAGNLVYGAAYVQDVTEQKAAAAELGASQEKALAALREKEILLQELHHRVKNNLQVISSLINMQGRALNDSASRAALEQCQRRVQAIALVHGQLYGSRDYSRVAFSEYARSLADNIVQAAGMSSEVVALDVAFDEVSLAMDKAIPCGLILNELITNAIKHAFPGNRRGVIRVEVRKISDRILLVVADDGVGLATTFDTERTGSLGMQLVSALVEQLDGRLEIVRASGTTFSLTFPAESQR